MLFVAFNPDQGFFRSLFSPWGTGFEILHRRLAFFRSQFSPCEEGLHFRRLLL
jgi:hypothetical protein